MGMDESVGGLQGLTLSRIVSVSTVRKHLVCVHAFKDLNGSDCSTPHAWWTVHSSFNLHGNWEEGFTVCALCYSTNNTLCALCAPVTDYKQVGVLVSF